ncbi:MAG TPA: ImmA/IrrE family metallo-endopeptidase [Fibrobacteraceae bacterium]|nr:ImmA/IrrE family metallo-endopeptidase [Fibrobacteraceae bacterium]
MTKSEIQSCGLGNAGIEVFADKVLKTSGIPLTGLQSLIQLVKKFGGNVHFSDEPDCDSITVDGKNSFTILLSKDATPERQSFSLAHELGHYFLHSQQGSVPLQAFRFGTHKTEQEANRFAAALLMPKASFEKKWHALSTADNLKPACLSIDFNVSLAAAENRAKSLGLLNAN